MSTMGIDQVLAQMRVMESSVKGSTGVNAAETQPGDKTAFGDILNQSIQSVNESQMKAKELTSAYSAGAPDVDLPEVMVSLQKASVSFQAVTQVRNQLLSAYKDVMSMQV